MTREREWPLTPNQVVAYNLERARRFRGWTQEQAGAKLEPFLGVRWTVPIFSAAERSLESTTRIRQFTADDLIAFARAFDLPVAWFLVPPGPDDAGRLPVIHAQTAPPASGLGPGAFVVAALGDREAQWQVDHRLTELRHALPLEETDERAAVERASEVQTLTRAVVEAFDRALEARAPKEMLEEVRREQKKATAELVDDWLRDLEALGPDALEALVKARRARGRPVPARWASGSTRATEARAEPEQGKEKPTEGPRRGRGRRKGHKE
jgi:hypothetical protein